MICAILLAVAVAASAPAGELPEPVTRQYVETNYKPDEPMSVVVGQTMVRAKGYIERKDYTWSVTTTSDTYVQSGRFGAFLSAGTPLTFHERRMARTGITYDIYVFKRYADGSLAAFNVDDNLEVQGYVFRDIGGTWRAHRKPAVFTPTRPGVKREIKENVVTVPTDKNFEIVYLGQDGPSLKFEYREYTDQDLVRAAFSQSLSYPKSAKTFRFRNLRFDQVRLSDDELTVKVSGEP